MDWTFWIDDNIDSSDEDRCFAKKLFDGIALKSIEF